MTHQDTCVGRVPIFRGLSPAQQGHVASFAHPVHAGAGDVLYAAGQPSSRLLVLHSGSIKISAMSHNGQEQILQVLGAGDVVGMSAFLAGRRPDHDAIALSRAELCVFDHADLQRLVSTYPDIALQLLHAVSERLASTERLLTAITSSDVGARVAAYLLDQPGIFQPDGSVVVQLPMAKKDIAAYLGTTPETLSRRLAALARRGVISVGAGRRIIILQPAVLEDANQSTDG